MRTCRAHIIFSTFCGIIIGMFATRVVHAAIAEATPSGDALIDAVSSSGPAAGAVLILAFVIKAWLTDLKSGLERLQQTINELTKADNAMSKDVVGLQSDIKDLNRRLDDYRERLGRIERRISGAATSRSPRSDEST